MSARRCTAFGVGDRSRERWNNSRFASFFERDPSVRKSHLPLRIFDK